MIARARRGPGNAARGTATDAPGSPRPRLDQRKAIQRERRLGERLHRDPHEQERVVVAGDPVARQRAAAVAAMNEHPLAVLPNGNGDRFHRGQAVGRAVARIVVEVTRPEAVRTVISVSGARCACRDVEPAVNAAERLSLFQG